MDYRTSLFLSVTLALAVGCNQDEDNDGETVVQGSSGEGDSTAAASSGTSSVSSGTSDASTTSATSSASTTEGTTASDSTGVGEPVECTAELTCDAGEVCVLPCCGGPAPACFPMPKGGDCGTGTIDKGGSCCDGDPDPRACNEMTWCIPGPCVAKRPYCTPMDTLTCDGSGSQCEVGGSCLGQLNDSRLECDCA